MACALGMEACKQRFKTKYIRLPDLLLDLEIARTENNYRKVMMKYANPRLLILDKWLLLKPTETEQHDILELLHARRKASSTIFCSQYHDSGWYDQLAVMTALWPRRSWTGLSTMPTRLTLSLPIRQTTEYPYLGSSD